MKIPSNQNIFTKPKLLGVGGGRERYTSEAMKFIRKSENFHNSNFPSRKPKPNNVRERKYGQRRRRRKRRRQQIIIILQLFLWEKVL
jgi:hypothetical protein